MRLVGILFVFLQACHSNPTSQLTHQSNAIFVGRLQEQRGQLKAIIDTVYKGCAMTKESIVTVNVPKSCSPSPTKTYLVTGQATGGPLKVSVSVSCEGLRPIDGVSGAELRFLYSSADKCKRGKRMRVKCPGGAPALQCQASKVCVKSKWCRLAKACKVNPCDCSPEYYDEHKNRVCTALDGFCPGGSPTALTTCRQDPCRASGPPLLEAQGCADWSEDARCVSSACGGCHAVWINDRGRELCQAKAANHVCQDVGAIRFGKCKRILGFAVHGGKCAVVSGCNARGYQFAETLQACQHTCSCLPLTHVDLGTCLTSLGFGVVDDECVEVRGCKPKARGVAHALHSTMAACTRTCGDAPLAPAVPALPAVTNGPRVVCPLGADGSNRLLVELPAGLMAGPVSYPPPEAFGEGVTLLLAQGVRSGGTVELGDTVVAYTAVDAQQRTASCLFTIVATPPARLLEGEDTQPPVLVCPGTLEEDDAGSRLVYQVHLAPNRPEATVLYPFPSSADNRPGATMKLLEGPEAGQMFPRGDTLVRFQATDAAGLASTCAFIVRLQEPEPNEPPASSSIPPSAATQGRALQLDLSPYFSDPEGDDLVYFVAGLPVGSGLTIEFDTGKLVGTPSFVDATAPSPLQVRIMASDGCNGRTIQELALTVLPDPDNAAPVLSTNPAAMTVTEGQAAALELGPLFTDPDGDKLEWYVADLPFGSGLQLSANALLTGTPSFADATAPQPLLLRVMASDGKASVVALVEVTVKPNPNNARPVSAGLEAQQGVEGELFSLDLGTRFDDDDPFDVLDYFVAGLPPGSGLTLYSSGVLSGRLSAADALAAQPLQIKILASDGQASTQQNFPLAVTAAAATRLEVPSPTSAAVQPTQPTVDVALGQNVDIKMTPYFAGRLQQPVASYIVQGGLPMGSGLSLDPTQGALYGVPNPLDLQAPQPLELSLTATSRTGDMVQQTVFVMVSS